MRILKDNTIALVVDFQEKLMPVMANAEELEKRTSILLKGLKVLEVPMIVTQQYTKGIGMTIESLREAAGTEEYFDKITFSCFDDDAIRNKIEKSGCKNVIVCGIESHICVLQTCIDLKEAGYTPILVTDCMSSRKESDKEGAIRRALGEGILLTTTEAILFELTRKAGNPQFKEISKLIK